MSDKALLQRCVAGMTQNQNESFNAALWKRCPKERYFGTLAVNRALAFAVIFWNSGHLGLIQILEELDLPVNTFTKQAIYAKDKKRISQAQYKTNCATKRRKLQKQSVSDDYVPGGY